VLIPAFDDGLRLGARGGIGNLPFGIAGNAHRGSIAESMRLIKWRNARSVGSGANHEGACRAFSTILHIGVFARRRRSYWRRSLTTLAKAATLKIAQEYERLTVRATSREMVKK